LEPQVVHGVFSVLSNHKFDDVVIHVRRLYRGFHRWYMKTEGKFVSRIKQTG